MNPLRMLVGALVGGAAGAAIWCAVGYFSGYEVGWIAWAVGLLSGLGVRVAANESEGFLPGAVAAVVAVLAVVGGKYAVVQVHLARAGAVLNIPPPNDSQMTVAIADEVADEWAKSGKKLAWPPGMTLEEATAEKDYPKDVWQEATKRWQALPPAERDRRKAEEARHLAEFTDSLRTALHGAATRDMFGPYDLLWGLFALVTAFRVGSGGLGGD